MRGEKLKGHLDMMANVAAIGTCILICAALLLQAAEKRKSARVALSALPPVFSVGTMLKPLPAVTFADAPLTVLVGLSTTCRYCDESMPSFRRLNDQIKSRLANRVTAVALGFEPAELLSDYLQRNALSGFRPVTIDRTSDLGAIIRRTPSVVLVDRRGEVISSWTGLMTDERLKELLQYLEATTTKGAARRVAQ